MGTSAKSLILNGFYLQFSLLLRLNAVELVELLGELVHGFDGKKNWLILLDRPPIFLL